MKLNGYQLVSEFFGMTDTNENPVIKKERLTKPFIYLYHGTLKNSIENIKKHGLDPMKQGSNNDAGFNIQINDIERITGKRKPVIFLASDPRYCKAYGNVILKCKVYTKHLSFNMAQKITSDGYLDEYLYNVKIPTKDIVIYKEI